MFEIRRGYIWGKRGYVWVKMGYVWGKRGVNFGVSVMSQRALNTTVSFRVKMWQGCTGNNNY